MGSGQRLGRPDARAPGPGGEDLRRAGRRNERLSQLWKEAASGERRLALLAGEPGIGKTRLAAELAHRAHDEGGVVLAGRCDEDLGVPYQPFVEALCHFVDHTPPPELTEHLGRYGGELARLVPELAERVPDLPPAVRADPETERYRLFDAVGGWLAAASSDQPVLLVIDDLHWAAKPTLLLLRHVLQFSDPLRLLILGTYRDTELGRRHPLADLLADLRRQNGVERRALGGLDAAAVVRYVEEVAGTDLPGDTVAFAGAIYAETEGNPFFIGEVIRHLAETGAVEQHCGRWVTTTAIEDLGIPEGIREVVGRRLSRLSDTANAVLAVAAVIGVEFEPGVLQHAAGMSEESVAAVLDAATAARLLSEASGSGRAGTYRFAHALVRATLYEELTNVRRVVLHRKVAEAIESLHTNRLQEHLPALAHHYAQSAMPASEHAKAVEYARRAGDAALGMLAHDDAVRYYRQALEHLTATEAPVDEPARLELLLALGEAEGRAGDPAYRHTLFEAAGLARRQQASAGLARAALLNCRGSLTSAAGRVDAERIELLETALDAIGGADSGDRARLMAHAALEQVWTADRAELGRMVDSALAMAHRLGDPATLADVMLSSFYAIHDPSTVGRRHALSEELLALAEHLGDERLAVHAYWHRTRSAVEVGDLAEARRCAEREAGLADKLGEPTLRWMAAVSASGPPLAAGRIREAEERTDAALAIGKDVQPDAATYWVAHLLPIRFEQGRLEEMLPFAMEFVADPGFRVAIAPAMATFIHAELGRLDECRRYYDQLAASRFADVRFDNIWLASLVFCGEAAVRLGDAPTAAYLYDRLTPYHDQVVAISSSPWNSVSHYLGKLAAGAGRYDDAERWFGEALRTQERLDAPGWMAHTRLEWARMLLARGRAGDAGQSRDLLGRALSSARELGQARVERNAVALLR